MAPKGELLLNWQQNQEVRQRKPFQPIQLHRVAIDKERDVELGIKNPQKQSSNNPLSFTQEGRRYMKSITTCLMIFFPKKTSTKKYPHGEFPL
jgi:hypothetical protein